MQLEYNFLDSYFMWLLENYDLLEDMASGTITAETRAAA